MVKMNGYSGLSDEELKEELLKHGISSPVTVSTRAVLLKQLYKLTSNTESANRNTYRSDRHEEASFAARASNKSLNSFSSDEDETPEGPPKLRRSPRGNASENGLNFKTTKTRRRLSQAEASRKYLDVTDNTRARKTSYQSVVLNSPKINGHQMEQEESDSYSDSDVDRSSEDITETGPKSFEDPCSSKFYKNFKIFDTEQDKRDLPVVSSVRNNEQRGIESCVFHNEFSPVPKFQSPEDIVTQERMPSRTNGDSFQGDQSTNDQNGSWLQLVPIILLVLLMVFFISIGMVYLNIPKPGLTNQITENDNEELSVKLLMQSDSRNKFPVCGDVVQQDCLTKSQMLEVPGLLAVIEEVVRPLLMERAVSYECGTSASYYISMKELQDQVKRALPSMSANSIEEGLDGIGKLAEINPHWGLEAEWHQTQVYPKTYELIGLSLANRPKQFLCYITKILTFAFIAGGSLAISAGFAWFMYKFVQQKNKKKNEDTEKTLTEVCEWVDKILQVLERSCGSGGEEYLPVNYVRDFLIPPRERGENIQIWKKAVEFLENHDSRIRREVRLVDGEETQIWRWKEKALKSPNRSPSNCLNDITLQQAAYYNTTMTTCLKIATKLQPHVRKEGDWPTSVQEDIVEKCSPAKIVHLAVDKASNNGCVFFKCQSPHDANIAFSALSSSSYNGSPMYPRFISEDRYLRRFPGALHLRTPLRHQAHRSSRGLLS